MYNICCRCHRLIDLLNSWPSGSSTCRSTSRSREVSWHPTGHTSRHSSSTLVQLGDDGATHLFQLLLLMFIFVFLCSLYYKHKHMNSDTRFSSKHTSITITPGVGWMSLMKPDLIVSNELFKATMQFSDWLFIFHGVFLGGGNISPPVPNTSVLRGCSSFI